MYQKFIEKYSFSAKKSQFMSFVRKEFYHIFRDKRTIMILLGMPIVEIILFGFAISTEVNNSRIAILDSSQDIATTHIINKIEASQYFDIVKIIHNEAEITSAFKRNEVDIIMVFSPQFNKNLHHTGKAQIQLIADATNPNIAVSLTNYATSIISSYQQELLAQYKVPYQIKPEIKLLYNPQMKSSYNFVPGVMGMILMLICAMMTAVSRVREKEMGTMEVLLVSPMKPIFIILAKAVPYFTLSFINLITILLLSVFVLSVPVAGSLFWLTAISLVFILVCLSLGLLISTVSTSQVMAMLISGMALMMPVMLLSGMMFPTENMPLPLQLISHTIPAKWYIIIVKKIMIEGLPITTVLKETAILCFMASVLIVISLKKFKNRLE
jgi:ABC-2 type transport system permease protein